MRLGIMECSLSSMRYSRVLRKTTFRKTPKSTPFKKHRGCWCGCWRLLLLFQPGRQLPALCQLPGRQLPLFSCSRRQPVGGNLLCCLKGNLRVLYSGGHLSCQMFAQYWFYRVIINNRVNKHLAQQSCLEQRGGLAQEPVLSNVGNSSLQWARYRSILAIVQRSAP